MKLPPTSEPEVYFRDGRSISKLRSRIWLSGVCGVIALACIATGSIGSSALPGSWKFGLQVLMGIGVGFAGASTLLLPLSIASFSKLKPIRGGKEAAGLCVSLVFGLASAAFCALILINMK